MKNTFKISIILVFCFLLLLINGCGTVNSLNDDDNDTYVRPAETMAISAEKIIAYYNEINTIVQIERDACSLSTDIIIDYNTVSQPAISHFGTATYDQEKEAFICSKKEKALYVYVYAKDPDKRISMPVSVEVK